MRVYEIDGNLAKDAEVLTSKAGGRKYVRFSVANHYYKGNEENVDWIDVYSFDNNVIENRYKWLLKGARVVVSGEPDFELKVRNGQAFINTRIKADRIDIIIPGKRDDIDTGATVSVHTKVEEPKVEAPAKSVLPEAAPVKEEDDDLPF